GMFDNEEPDGSSGNSNFPGEGRQSRDERNGTLRSDHLPCRQSGSRRNRSRDRRCAETPVGPSRQRQVQRRESDLLLPQRIDTPIRAGHLRQEPESEPVRRGEKGGAQNDRRNPCRTQQEEIAAMRKQSKPKTKRRASKGTAA